MIQFRKVSWFFPPFLNDAKESTLRKESQFYEWKSFRHFNYWLVSKVRGLTPLKSWSIPIYSFILLFFSFTSCGTLKAQQVAIINSDVSISFVDELTTHCRVSVFLLVCGFSRTRALLCVLKELSSCRTPLVLFGRWRLISF